MSQINITVREYIEMYSDIIGNDPEEQCSIDLVNKARIIAYPTGDWVGTVGYEKLSTNNGNFVLPTEYESIREAKYVCGGNVQVETGPINQSDYFSCASPVVITKLAGRTYSPIQLTENCALDILICNSRDEGKSIRVIYSDSNGSSRDETIILSETPTRLQYLPSSIKRISKQRTVGSVILRSNGKEGIVKAFETSPVYSIYCILPANSCSGAIYYKAKKRCIPYTIDDLDDPLDINPEALSSFCLATKFKSDREATWFSDYTGAIKLGKDLLKAEYLNEQETIVGIKPIFMSEDNFFEPLLDNQ